MMRKVMYAAALCGMIFLAGCGPKQKATMAPANQPKQAANQEPAVVEITGGQPTDPVAAPTLPPSGDTGAVDIATLDSAASVDESDPKQIVISGGQVEITVNHATLDRSIRVEEGGSLRLLLENEATFAGAITGADLQSIYVSLDATSIWTMNGDSIVGSIVNQVPSFSNVHSGGFALEYDSESAHNAYLAGAAKQLPGGGFLTPVI